MNLPASEIIASYNLPSNLEWQYLGDQHMNRTWFVLLNGLPNWVLRQYVRVENLPEIEAEHALLNFLHAQLGSLVAPPLPGLNNQTITSINNAYFALFPFRVGEEMKRSVSAQLVPAAQMLARLHTYTASFSLPGFARLRPSLIGQSLEIPAEAYEMLATHPHFAALLTAGYQPNKLQAEFSSIQTDLNRSKLAQVRFIVIHADYIFRNILWLPAEQKISCVLDWEEARLDLPLFDVASAAGQFGNSTAEQAEFVKIYLAELAKHNPQLAQEVEATLPYLNLIQRTVYAYEFLLCLKLHCEAKSQFSTRYALKLGELLLYKAEPV